MGKKRDSNFNLMWARWREWNAVVWTRRRQALVLFILIVGVGAGILSRKQPIFESSMKILISRARSEAATAADASVPSKAEVTLEELNSEVEIIGSRELLEAVARAQGVSDVAVAASQMAARLSVSVVDQSRIIKVAYRDHSPEEAARTLDTLFRKYAEHRQKLRPQINIESALQARSEDFSKKLEEATAALKQIDSEQGFKAGATQQELQQQQLHDVRRQADAARTEKLSVEQQVAALRAQIATQPEQVEVSSVTKYVQALDKMKEELIALEMNRTQLLQKYQPQHRLIKDTDQRIAQVKELIAREEQNPPRERSIALNEIRRRLANDLLAAETQLAGLAQREKQLNELVQQYQLQLSALNLQNYKKNDLERQRTLNEEAFLLYQKKAQEAAISAVYSQAADLQVTLAEAAGINPHPVSPDWPLSLACLLSVGLLISVGSVVTLESFHPRLRHEAGLRRRFGLVVLAKLPPAQDASPQT